MGRDCCEPVNESHSEFELRYSVRTDLALEAHDLLVKEEGPPEIPGVEVDTEQTEHALISRIKITNDIGARMMGKVKGTYSTIEAPGLRERDRNVQKAVSQIFSRELLRFMQDIGPEDLVLLVGLGNWNSTPDSLGPKVVSRVLVTRHLYELTPPEKRGGLRPVSAISPGVMGITGMETSEIVFGVVQRTSPAMVVCIDALASRNIKRLCTTIQIADTGIHPGSGVGNVRMGITHDVLGIPVLAVGVPTVVHASTIVSDAIDILTGRGLPEGVAGEMPARVSLRLTPGNIRWGGTTTGSVNPERGVPASADGDGVQVGGKMINMPVDPVEKRQLINQLLEPYIGTMIVTPKEIDVLIADVTDVLAGGFNAALHPNISEEEIRAYLR